MPSVILKKPNRVNTLGMMFDRGVVTPVSGEIASALEDNERFIVKWDRGEREGVLAEEAASGPRMPAARSKRLTLIRAAIDKLSPDDEGVWTKDGRPDARALSRLLGWTVTNEERDMALSRANAEEQLPILDTAEDEVPVEDAEEETRATDIPTVPERPVPHVPTRKKYRTPAPGQAQPRPQQPSPPIIDKHQIRPGSEANVAAARGKVVIKKGPSTRTPVVDPTKAGAVEV